MGQASLASPLEYSLSNVIRPLITRTKSSSTVFDRAFLVLIWGKLLKREVAKDTEDGTEDGVAGREGGEEASMLVDGARRRSARTNLDRRPTGGAEGLMRRGVWEGGGWQWGALCKEERARECK